MRTIKINLYKFDELVVDAQQNAIEDNSLINVDYDWWNTTYDDAKSIDLEITSFALEHNKYAKGKFITDAKQCAEKIIEEHGDDCETTSLAVGYLAGYDNINNDEEDETLEELDAEFLEALLSAYVDMLEKESEYLQTENAIRETLISNDYEFTKNGKRFIKPY